jgi:hypothetical protein
MQSRNSLPKKQATDRPKTSSKNNRSAAEGLKPLPAAASKTPLEITKLIFDMVQTIATILAILAGGYWFLLQRSTVSQIKLDQTITQRSAANEPHTILVAIEVHATNVGKVKVELEPGQLDVMQINPRTDTPLNLKSYALNKLTLEPGESDQAIFQVLPVYDTVKTIQVHSCYEVPQRSAPRVTCAEAAQLGQPDDVHKYWNLLSVADLGADANRKESATSIH